MRAALSTLKVVRPKSLAHALKELAASDEAGDRLKPIAGGTDLFVDLNAGTQESCRYLNLWGLRELRGIRVSRERTVVGALTTFSEIREHAVIRRRYPMLVDAASLLGGRQNQNRATLAGNIANASPAGDSLPALMALGAVIRARSVRGERSIWFDELYLGYRTLALAADELITSVILPTQPARSTQFFRKVGTRRAQSIAKVVLGGVIRFDRKTRIDHIRISLGSVAPVTLRARHVEEALLGMRPARASARAARAALADDIAPIDDIRSQREYRSTISGNVLEQFLRTADPRFASD